jgi:hypothetical protein
VSPCALCAHRYTLGHGSWIGEPSQGVVVLPGTGLPELGRVRLDLAQRSGLRVEDEAADVVARG